jgi:hypothetical protein
VAELTVYLSPDNDTVGEPFELNVAAAQEAGTLVGIPSRSWQYAFRLVAGVQLKTDDKFSSQSVQAESV